MLLLLSFLFLLFFQDSEPLLSPAMVAVATAIVTLALSGIALWQLNFHRARGVIGALTTSYGIVAPFISTFPRGVGIALAIVGIILTLTAERLQGGASNPEKRAAAADSDRRNSANSFYCLAGALVLALVMTACGPVDVLRSTAYALGAYIEDARADGEIIPDRATAMLADVSDILRMVDSLDYGLKVVKGMPGEKQSQVAEVRTFARGFAQVYARGNFVDVNPKVERWIKATRHALVALEAYYASRAGERPPAESVAVLRNGTPVAKGQKQLKREMDDALKELKAARADLKN